MEYGNNGQPDKATIATEPGKLAGPFEVKHVVRDDMEFLPSEEELRRWRRELLEYTERNRGLMSPAAQAELAELRAEDSAGGTGAGNR